MKPTAREADGQKTTTPARRREILGELKGLVGHAQGGDEEALSKVRELCREDPRLAKMFIDLANTAERHFLKRMARDDPLAREVLPAQLRTMRKELAGPNPSPLEKLLAERIVACWLQLQYADAVYARNLGNLQMR